MKDLIEFCEIGKKGAIAACNSSIIPPVGALISIRKKAWKVIRVTYALDFADREMSERIVRANVEIEAHP